MAVIRSYALPTVESRPAPNAVVPGNAPVGAFGNSMQTEGDARATMQAGAFLDRASDTTERMALSMMEEANEARVQELANGFMSASQNKLFIGDDAFYRKRGQDAINGAQGATDALLELKRDAIGLAANTTQRRRLSKMLDTQVLDATNGISRYVAAQSLEWQKGVAEGRQQILLNSTAHQWGDIEAVEKNALAAESTAREQARQQGFAGTERETAMVVAARSNHFATAITQQMQNDQKRSALTLYNRVKGQLDDRDSARLATAMRSVATVVEAEDWITRHGPSGLPAAVRQYGTLVQQVATEEGVDPALVMAVMARESAGERSATSKAGAGGLMQLMPGTARDLGVGDVYNEAQNVRGGTRYLGQMLAKYSGDQQLALMAYNWGPGNVDNWVKTGRDPAKVPEETRKYVPAVQAFLAGQGVGFDKAAAKGLVFAAQEDPSISVETRQQVAAIINKRSESLEASRNATIAGLKDRSEAVQLAIALDPGSVPPGTLASFGAAFRAAGDLSLAVQADGLAAMEDYLRSFSTAPKSAQEEMMRSVAVSMMSGKGKEVATALLSANTKDKADATREAGEAFEVLKMDQRNGVRMETRLDNAKAVIEGFQRGGSPVKAREAMEWFNGQVEAQYAGQQPPQQLTAGIADLRVQIEAGDRTSAASRKLDAMRTIESQQNAAFDKDALAAGAAFYRDLGPLPPATDFAGRAAYAEQISQRRGGAPVLPFTEPEIAQIRTNLENAAPAQQAKTMMALSALPAVAIPGVASALAGKGEGGDQLSRSYAAALSFYAEKNPASKQVADQILQGAKLVKDGGDGVRKPAVTGEAWRQQTQEHVGNLLRDADPRMVASVTDAIASVYVYRMNRAGRQGENTDTDMLDAAIKAVVGEPVVRNGQSMLPPVRGMTAYDVDKAMRSLKDDDLQGLHTSEGDPITADVVMRKGILTNGRNGEGWYFVRIPDPRAGMDPRPVVGPDGREFQLDMRPLVERANRFPEGLAPAPGAPAAARRRAPVSPTEGVAP